MTGRKRIVLDANILLRAVFGVRVRHLLEIYEDSVLFYAPTFISKMLASTFLLFR